MVVGLDVTSAEKERRDDMAIDTEKNQQPNKMDRDIVSKSNLNELSKGKTTENNEKKQESTYLGIRTVDIGSVLERITANVHSLLGKEYDEVFTT